MHNSPTDILARPVGKKIRPVANLPALDLATASRIRSLAASILTWQTCWAGCGWTSDLCVAKAAS